MKMMISLIVVCVGMVIATDTKADEQIQSSVRWKVEMEDKITHEVKTFSLSQWGGKVSLPSSTNWKCDVESADGKSAISVERSVDGTIAEHSTITCRRGDTEIFAPIVCFPILQGKVVPPVLVHATITMGVMSGTLPNLKATSFTLSCGA